MHRSLYLIHCLSALHIGSGEETGSVDLPVMRLRPYDLPFIPTSAMKGCWRAHAREQQGKAGQAFADRQTLIEYFGPDRLGANEHGGALQFNSGQLLCLPVRSFHGTFAWASCPMQLALLVRDAAVFHAGSDLPPVPILSENDADNRDQALLPQSLNADDQNDGSVLARPTDQVLLLEDLDLRLGSRSEAVTQWASQIADWVFPAGATGAQRWRTLFAERFCIIDDASFKFFAGAAMDVRHRNTIDEQSGAVRDKMLWTEEHVPAESIFWGGMAVETHAFNAQGHRTRALNLDPFTRPTSLQLGGKATLGHGQIQWYLQNAAPGNGSELQS